MQKEILFDALTAQEVASRLAVIRENQTAVNMIALTVARMNGAGPDDRIGLNDAGTGIVVSLAPPIPPEGGEFGAAPGTGNDANGVPEMSGKRQK